MGWLLKCTKTVGVAQDAKLALFLDWLTYVPAEDNIMNIEPGVLLLYRTASQNPAMAVRGSPLHSVVLVTHRMPAPLKQPCFPSHIAFAVVCEVDVVGVFVLSAKVPSPTDDKGRSRGDIFFVEGCRVQRGHPQR